MHIAQTIRALPEQERIQALADILTAAREAGAQGFGGRCGAAALAIQAVLFADQEDVAIAGALNAPLWERHQYAIGHVGVEDHEGWVWDLDAYPKGSDDIEHWGMLDEEDPDYQALAARFGETLSAIADDVAIFTLSEGELRASLGTEGRDTVERHLREAADAWSARRTVGRRGLRIG